MQTIGFNIYDHIINIPNATPNEVHNIIETKYPDYMNKINLPENDIPFGRLLQQIDFHTE